MHLLVGHAHMQRVAIGVGETATVLMPILRADLWTRQAISRGW
jgi:hypothetical protein